MLHSERGGVWLLESKETKIIYHLYFIIKGMKNQITLKDELTEFLIYTSPSGETKVEVFFQNESVWLTQERMAELFGVKRQAITKHLINIFNESELEENATSSILEQVQMEGIRQVNREIKMSIRTLLFLTLIILFTINSQAHENGLNPINEPDVKGGYRKCTVLKYFYKIENFVSNRVKNKEIIHYNENFSHKLNSN